jgi:hypothetical protein
MASKVVNRFNKKPKHPEQKEDVAKDVQMAQPPTYPPLFWTVERDGKTFVHLGEGEWIERGLMKMPMLGRYLEAQAKYEELQRKWVMTLCSSAKGSRRTDRIVVIL